LSSIRSIPASRLRAQCRQAVRSGFDTKILTEGALLATLGADYRFHTRVYRTGPIDKHGTLKGDLVLVATVIPIFPIASSPMELSPSSMRITLTRAPLFPAILFWSSSNSRKMSQRKGIHKIEGRVLIDTTLFPDGPREGAQTSSCPPLWSMTTSSILSARQA